MSAFRALGLVVLLVLSGCAAPVDGPGAAGGDDSDDAWEWPEDPPDDRLGWEAGYWHNESIAVDQSDGLNDSEREAFVARTMARVEVIRGLEFTEPVSVDVVSRAEYRESSPFGEPPGPEDAAWNDQVWESLFLVGEDRNVTAVLGDLYDGSVLGYYSPSRDGIVIVSDSGQPTIGRATLAHELVHALQDQRFGIPARGQTQDVQLARDGLIEGDARYVEQRYERRCGGEWECVENPPQTGGGGGSVDIGVFLTVYAPYSEGPTLVYRLKQRGEWEAVNDAYETLPESTEQVLHPEAYPDETPATIHVADRSGPSWSRFDRTPQMDTVGEASLFASFWANDAIESDVRQRPGPYSEYNYSAPVTSGWAGDGVIPYRSDDGEYGYVFRSEWDTEADAEAFARTYTDELLRAQFDAERVATDTYVIRDGPFADAFRVERDGTTVTVVNAPTVEDLESVHGE